jgi:putative nucleotidyltransferase with HDIG domain
VTTSETVAEHPAGVALRSRLENPDAAIPMLPDFAHRVIDMVSDEEVSVMQLSAVVSKDQVLASRLLGLANSAYFAAISEISTVQDAIVRMGTAAVRNLVVTVCFYSRMQDRNVYGERGKPLLEHGIGTAYMARLVADQVGADQEEAFMYGLLHDIGKLVILKAAYDVRRQLGTPVPDAVLDELIRELHPQVGAHVLRKWRLPSMLDEPILCHHDWKLAKTQPQKAAITYLANRLSHRYGFGCDVERTDDLALDPVCTQLKVDQAWIEQTDRHAPGLVEVAKKILG